jgi:hypothetical protein
MPRRQCCGYTQIVTQEEGIQVDGGMYGRGDVVSRCSMPTLADFVDGHGGFRCVVIHSIVFGYNPVRRPCYDLLQLS